MVAHYMHELLVAPSEAQAIKVRERGLLEAISRGKLTRPHRRGILLVAAPVPPITPLDQSTQVAEDVDAANHIVACRTNQLRWRRTWTNHTVACWTNQLRWRRTWTRPITPLLAGPINLGGGGRGCGRRELGG
jgi:hypothetical protein